MAGVWLKQKHNLLSLAPNPLLYTLGVYTGPLWGKKLKGVTLVTRTQHVLYVRGHLWATLPQGWFGWG